MPPNTLENLLEQLLIKAFSERLKLKPESVWLLIKPPLLEPPKEKSFGDISTSAALKLAPLLRRKPLEIARELVAYLEAEIPDSELRGRIEKIEIAGAGFINFYLSREYFLALLKDILNLQNPFICPPKSQEKVLLEFVSANPTGPLSVAHGRQAAVGDALANILELLGYDVSREFYLNDEGNQINILGNSIYLRLEELKGEKIEFPENHYQGEYIVELARELYQSQVAGHKPEGSGLASNSQSHKSQEYCKEYGVKRILEIIRQELEDFGVKFDSWFSQADLQKSGKIEEVIASLRAKGFIYDSEGAVWFASSKLGDDKDRVIVKSDGSYTYLAPDIAYHQDKFRRGFDWLINLWGPDHHGYIPRMEAAVTALGKQRKALAVIIVQLATLYKEGKVVSMSTRKGEYVTLRQVMDEVGRDAARFFFLMRKTDSHLDFDLELAKRQHSENPVYYVQYAHARISNILSNAAVSLDEIKAADLSLLKEKEELGLLRALAGLGHSLKIAEVQLDPYNLTVYLQELAMSFHRFYDAQRVLLDDKKLRDARLSLILGCKTIIALGLKLLGVSAPEKM